MYYLAIDFCFRTETQLIYVYRPNTHGTMTNNILNYNKCECITLFTHSQKERARVLVDPVTGLRKSY